MLAEFAALLAEATVRCGDHIEVRDAFVKEKAKSQTAKHNLGSKVSLLESCFPLTSNRDKFLLAHLPQQRNMVAQTYEMRACMRDCSNVDTAHTAGLYFQTEVWRHWARFTNIIFSISQLRNESPEQSRLRWLLS